MAIVTDMNRLINRRTKIVATVGPGSANPGMLADLMEAGVDVFRLNMSHGSHEDHARVYQWIRELAHERVHPIAILADLCGPKIRTGAFAGGGIDLAEGDEVTVTTRPGEGKPGLIVSRYEALARDVRPGDRILLADGLFELSVLSVEGDDIQCRVVQGGFLTDNKGINLPGVDVSAPALTDKDREDARFALDLGVDYLALSFVRTAAEIESLRALVNDSGKHVAIVAKIEKPEALDNAESILAATDAIMVARGDLGVELPAEQVPVAQKLLVEMARQRGKPVIVATQMLESMIEHARPTRAEVTDVSHAVASGADAVMLSAETAVGRFPIEAVSMMDRIARQTEAYQWQSGEWGTHRELVGADSVASVVANAAAGMSRELAARAVIVVTQSGISAQTVSAARPAAPVLALTPDDAVFQRMAMIWGVVPILSAEAGQSNPNDLAKQVASRLDLGVPGQHLLLVRGVHDDRQMSQPTVTVLTL